MSETKTYKYIIDGGHGWLRVPLREMRNHGFTPTHYSYFDEMYAYLEEDCDMPAFLNTVPAKVEINDEYQDGQAYVPRVLGGIVLLRQLPQFRTADGESTYHRLKEEREAQVR